MTDFSCQLYRMFDADGALLYVGVTRNLAARKSQHWNKPWRGEVVEITTEDFGSRIAAEEAEREAIRIERPRHNKSGLTRPYTMSREAAAEEWERGEPERKRQRAEDEAARAAGIKQAMADLEREVAELGIADLPPDEMVKRLFEAGRRGRE